jgi:hypothetical protein
MSTMDDRAFRKIVSNLLRDLADKVDTRNVDAVEFEALPFEECPPGYAMHAIRFKVRRSA